MQIFYVKYLLTGSAVNSATSWYRNGQPTMNLYLPFEGGVTAATQDYSGNSRTTSTLGSVNWIPNNGHDGTGGISLNGSSFINSSSGFPTNSSYTTCAWIKQTTVSGYSFIFGSNNTSLPGHGFRMAFDGRLTAGHNNNWRIAETNQRYAFLPNNWYFVAVTFDRSSGEMIIYKDGVPLDTGFVSANALNISDSSVKSVD